MYISSQEFNIIIDCGISATGHGREVVDGLNATYKGFIFHLTEKAQLTSSKRFYTKMDMDILIQNSDVMLSQEFQRHLSNA